MAGPIYLNAVPIDVPDGMRLVHNFPPGQPRRPAGDRGFRYWLEPIEDNDRRHPCACSWDAPEHFSTWHPVIDPGEL